MKKCFFFSRMPFRVTDYSGSLLGGSRNGAGVGRRIRNSILSRHLNGPRTR